MLKSHWIISIKWVNYFGHLMWRTDSFEKTLVLGKIVGRRRRGWEDELVGWHHRLNAHGFGWTPAVGDGQGGLVGCSSRSRKELDTTQRLNNNNYRKHFYFDFINWKKKCTAQASWIQHSALGALVLKLESASDSIAGSLVERAADEGGPDVKPKSIAF